MSRSKSLCSICCDPLKKSIQCSACDAISCQSCAKQYLMTIESLQGHCLFCRAEWSDEFIAKSLTKTWWSKAYRLHLKDVLETQARARLPLMMEAVEQYRFFKSRCKLRASLNYKIANLDSRFHKPGTEGEMNSKLKALMAERDQVSDWIDGQRPRWKQWFSSWPREQEGAVEDRPQYLFSCPQEGCRGFVNARTFACGLCQAGVCRECRCVLNKGHHCSEEDVASVKAIKEETKPCPKCHAPIFRIEGCAQMFCTQCHTPFNWVTGKEVTGAIHNPHYFEWLGSRTAEPRDCGDIINHLLRRDDFPNGPRILRLYHLLTEIEDGSLSVMLPPVPNSYKLAAKYLLGLVDDAKWKKTLMEHHRAEERRRFCDALVQGLVAQIRPLFEEMVTLGFESLADTPDSGTGSSSLEAETRIKELLDQVEQLRVQANGSSEAYSRLHGYTIYHHLDSRWYISRSNLPKRTRIRATMSPS